MLSKNFYWKYLSVISTGEVCVKCGIRHFLYRTASNTMIRILMTFHSANAFLSCRTFQVSILWKAETDSYNSYFSCVIFTLSFILDFLALSAEKCPTIAGLFGLCYSSYVIALLNL